MPLLMRMVPLAGCVWVYSAALLATEHRWMDTRLSPDQRAAMVLQEMTLAEKLSLVSGYFAAPQTHYVPPAEALPLSAGYVPGVARLGIPPLWETDSGTGVATQRGGAPRERTALPSGLATAASWNPDLAERGGAMIGSEARSSGFNVLLAGGINLVREPRNGRNFEYAGEDPLLAGVMVGAQIRGIQSNHIVATLKHYAVNDQESGRNVLDSRLADAPLRMSDLLAFQIAIEQSDPGSVMCAYNRVNGVYACESDYLLRRVLKGDWAYRGWVMSDWGGVHSTVRAANHGLDQESASSFDKLPYFGAALKAALANGQVPAARLDNMVHRILRTLFSKGVVDAPVVIAPIDFAAHAAITEAVAEEAAVLLKNVRQVLPLSARTTSIAVVGSHADVGVLSGGGSAQVYPVGGIAVPDLGPKDFPGPMVYFPSSPLNSLRLHAPAANVQYAAGNDIRSAVELARHSEVAVVFVHQWTAESRDSSLRLPDNQDALVKAVAAANSHTVVVLETGGPVFMPWLAKVSAVLEVWYPGTRGAEAIGRLLFGEANPSGRLPISFPRQEQQLPRPRLDGDINHLDRPFAVDYREGAAVGYKWFDREHLQPLFPFGYGLSYTRFEYSGIIAKFDHGVLTVSFDIKNAGERAGKDVPQVYVGPLAGGWESPRRLVGWKKLELASGARQHVVLTIDQRLLGVYDGTAQRWTINPGEYKVEVGSSARHRIAGVMVHVAGAEAR